MRALRNINKHSSRRALGISLLKCCDFASKINSFPPSAAYMRQVNSVSIGSCNGLSPVRRQAITWSNADFVNWTPGNKFKWNLNLNRIISIQEIAFENVRMAATLSRGEMS